MRALFTSNAGSLIIFMRQLIYSFISSLSKQNLKLIYRSFYNINLFQCIFT